MKREHIAKAIELEDKLQQLEQDWATVKTASSIFIGTEGKPLVSLVNKQLLLRLQLQAQHEIQEQIKNVKIQIEKL